MDLVSIIIPVYNVEKYMKECFDSVLNQDYQHIEIIIVDDGSTDNSGSICDSYARKDSRIRVFHKKNGGLGSARNFGLQKLSDQTKYIAFIDSDDVYSENFISNLYNAVTSNEADIGITRFVRINDKHEIVDRPCENVIKEGVFSTEEIINLSVGEGGWCFRTAWNKLYRKELFDGKKYWSRIHEDEAIIYSILLSCKKAVCIETEDYYYRAGNPTSIMSTMKKKRNADLLDAYLHNTKLLAANGYNFAARKTMLRAAREYSSLKYDKYENIDKCKIAYKKTLRLIKAKHILSVAELVFCTFIGICPTLGYKLLVIAKKV